MAVFVTCTMILIKVQAEALPCPYHRREKAMTCAFYNGKCNAKQHSYQTLSCCEERSCRTPRPVSIYGSGCCFGGQFAEIIFLRSGMAFHLDVVGRVLGFASWRYRDGNAFVYFGQNAYVCFHQPKQEYKSILQKYSRQADENKQD